MARPVVWTEEKIAETLELINNYTDSTDIPSVAEFCYTNNIRKQRLYEIDELSDAIKRLIEKKEWKLEIGALYGDIDKTMAIFSLKQLGWTDKQEMKIEGGETPVEIKQTIDKVKAMVNDNQ